MVLRVSTRSLPFRLRDSHPLRLAFPDPSTSARNPSVLPYNPERLAVRFGLLPFRSPLLRESSLFLWVLRCFSSPGSPPLAMCSPTDALAFPSAGFPIRISSALAVAHTSPRLFAVYHVLLRQLTPRHPPCALSSLSPQVIRRRVRSRVTLPMLLLSCPGYHPVSATQLPLACTHRIHPLGDEGTRTPDLCLAKAPLSRLSYVPLLLRLWV